MNHHVAKYVRPRPFSSRLSSGHADRQTHTWPTDCLTRPPGCSVTSDTTAAERRATVCDVVYDDVEGLSDGTCTVYGLHGLRDGAPHRQYGRANFHSQDRPPQSVVCAELQQACWSWSGVHHHALAETLLRNVLFGNTLLRYTFHFSNQNTVGFACKTVNERNC